MYKYTGIEDPTRVSKEELGSEEVETHLSFLTGPKAIADSKKVIVKAFSVDHPPSGVSLETSATLFI